MSAQTKVVRAVCMANIPSNSDCISSKFMGLPIAGVLRNSQSKAAGNPTKFEAA